LTKKSDLSWSSCWTEGQSFHHAPSYKAQGVASYFQGRLPGLVKQILFRKALIQPALHQSFASFADPQRDQQSAAFLL
jgi:hypothetical protein